MGRWLHMIAMLGGPTLDRVQQLAMCGRLPMTLTPIGRRRTIRAVHQMSLLPDLTDVLGPVALYRPGAVLRLLILLLGGAACTESGRVGSTTKRAVEASAASPVEAGAAAPPGDVSAIEPPLPPTAPLAADEAPSHVSAAERFLREERRRRGRAADSDEPSLCGEQSAAPVGLLVALCNAGGGAHADSGWVDFYHIEERRSGIRVRAQLLHVDSASGFGNSGDVVALDLGKGAPGFLIRGSYGNQGESYQSLVVVALLRHAWKEVARLEHLVDNGGSNDCADHPEHCVHLEFTLRPKPGPTPRDLEAALVGTHGRRRVAQRHVLRFDDTRGTYPVPKALRVAP